MAPGNGPTGPALVPAHCVHAHTQLSAWFIRPGPAKCVRAFPNAKPSFRVREFAHWCCPKSMPQAQL